MKGEIKMETTLHFAQNADAGTEESYLRNLPLLKLLAKENIEADDWSVLLAATPNNEDKLLWCLGYTGTLCALDATDFDDWVVYCSTVVLSALEACGVEASDERKNLLSIVLPPRDSACAVHENQLCDEWQAVVLPGSAALVCKISRDDVCDRQHRRHSRTARQVQSGRTWSWQLFAGMESISGGKEGFWVA